MRRGDSGTPPGCLPFFPKFRGSARRARTPGYPLATLRVAGACAPGAYWALDAGKLGTRLHTTPFSEHDDDAQTEGNSVCLAANGRDVSLLATVANDSPSP